MDAPVVQIVITAQHLLVLVGSILTTGTGLGVAAWLKANKVQDSINSFLSSVNHARGQYDQLATRLETIEHKVELLDSRTKALAP